MIMEKAKCHKYDDISGQRFGKLTVIKRADDYISTKGKKYVRYECLCDCGNTKCVMASDLKKGATKSCGCGIVKHNLKNSRLYREWAGMLSRCRNNNDPRYEHYGGRGIGVCKEWEGNFVSFYDWATANGYDDRLSIDRMDVNGNYCPENCRWADLVTQANNRTNNIKFIIGSSTHTLSEWCKIFSLNYHTIWSRMKKGQDVFTALFRPYK